jgi:hypothetical protein
MIDVTFTPSFLWRKSGRIEEAYSNANSAKGIPKCNESGLMFTRSRSSEQITNPEGIKKMD